MSEVALHFIDRGKSVGDAPLLLFLHHYGGSSRTWTEVIDALVVDFRCIAVDLRGFGDSPTAPSDSGYRVDENADDIVGVLESLQMPRYVLVGHSMGGKFALAVAARTAGTPLSPLALALIAPSPPTPEPMTDDDRAQTRSSWGDRTAAIKTIETIAAHPLPRPMEERTIEDMLRTSEAAWVAWEDSGSKENIADRMRSIAIPVQVAVGDQDPVVPAEVQKREVLARLPQATLTIIPGAGHLLPLEATAEVVRLAREMASGHTAW